MMPDVGGIPASLVVGAVRGLYDLVQRYQNFQPLLNDLNLELQALESIIAPIEIDNPVLEDPLLKSIVERMNAGKELVKKIANRWPIIRSIRKAYDVDKLGHLKGTIITLKNILSMYERRKMTELVEKIKESSETSTVLTKITDWRCSLPVTPVHPVGFEKSLRELKTKLLKDTDDGNPQPMMFITAPGGFGKTALAKMLCHDTEVKDKFKKNIFFVNISKEPKLHSIVKRLYEHKGLSYNNPDAENELYTETWLRKFLEEPEQASLLVLDEVWFCTESRNILEKFCKYRMPKCSILVTTRFKFPLYGRSHHLEPLEDADAEKLFCCTASLGDNCKEYPNIKKVVKSCKGLPLAIEEAAKSLSGRHHTIWSERKEGSILRFERVVLDRLRSSLSELVKEDDNIKECFIDLASFPEDQIIPAAALIDMWSALYNLDADVYCIANLHKLTDMTLANIVFPSDEMEKSQKTSAGYYSEYFVTQHDMLRELAVYETSRGPIEERERLILGSNIPKRWIEQKYQPIKARLLSILSDEVYSTHLLNIELPKVEVLLLNLQTNDKNALPQFVKKVHQLKVLIVAYYGSSSATAKLGNFQLLGSLSNLKRIRLERISVSFIIDKTIQLGKLEKISLFMCEIGKAFSIRFFEAFPKLEEINIDNCFDLVKVPAQQLCGLNLLKKLSITNCHSLLDLPEEIENLVQLEELRLLSCTKLKKLPDTITNLGRLTLLDVSGCSNLTTLPQALDRLEENLIKRECPLLTHAP